MASPGVACCAAVVLALVTACTGNASGTDNDDDGYTGGGGPCQTEVTVLPTLDTVGITGESAADLLEIAGGLFEGSLQWKGPDPIFYHVNGGTSTPVDVEVVYAGGEIRQLDGTLVGSCGHDGPCPCGDFLEVDVTLRIVSEDGALDETMVVALQSGSDEFGFPAVPNVYHPFDPDADPGGLQSSDLITPETEFEGMVVPPAELIQMILTAEFRDGASTGRLNAELAHLGGVVFGGFASWSAIREGDEDSACVALPVYADCEAAGCVAVPGWSMSEGAQCACNGPNDYCLADAPAPGDETQLWARPMAEDWWEVVAFNISEPLPAPWVPCPEHPEIYECGCMDGMATCP